MRRLITLIVMITLMALPLSAATPKSTHARSDLWQRLNQERHARNLPNLKWNGRLSEYAARWSKKMSTQGFSHSKFTGLFEPGSPYNYLGENIARGSKGVSAGSLHVGLMGSSGHRNNMLSPAFTEAGIGVYCSTGGMWITTVFARRWTDGPVPPPHAPWPKYPIVRSDPGTVKC